METLSILPCNFSRECRVDYQTSERPLEIIRPLAKVVAGVVWGLKNAIAHQESCDSEALLRSADRSPSTACRIIRKVEKILSQARVFTLPGKKRLYQTDSAIDVVVIDVTETPIERPKKNKSNTLVARRKSTLLSLNL